MEVVDVNVQYLDENGKLISENIKSFCKNFLLKRFTDATAFINAWKAADSKTKFTDALCKEGLFLDELRREYDKGLDVYDIFLKTAYDVEPKTRLQRVAGAQSILNRLTGDKHDIFADILGKYVEIGVSALESRNILRIEPFTSKYGTGMEIIQKIGGSEQYLMTIAELKQAIYAV